MWGGRRPQWICGEKSGLSRGKHQERRDNPVPWLNHPAYASVRDYLIDHLPGSAVLAATGAAGAAVLLLALWLLRRRRRRATAPAAQGSEGQESRPLSPAERLREALGATRAALGRGFASIRGRGGRADFLEGLEEALIVADVGVTTTASLLARLRRELGEEGQPDHVVEVLARLVHEMFLGVPPAYDSPQPEPGSPRVILVTGVNGVGKTTTIAKLGTRYVKEGRQVMFVAADTFRAAAAEQLERWGTRIGAAVISQRPGGDPAAVVVDGLRSARARGVDVVIVDTAGRLHTKTNLMEELRKIRRVAGRECPGAPHETLLVLDATTGQNGIQQARLFGEAVDVTGVVLTKMDGTARGGIAVAIVAELGLPVRFLGLGEGPDDLAPFDAGEFVQALLSSEGAMDAAPAREEHARAVP